MKSLEEMFADVSALIAARPQIAEAAREEADEEARLVRGIPEGYRWARVGSPLMAERIKASGPLPVVAPTGAVFVGPAGAGKTSYAVAWLIKLRQSGVRGTFVHSHTLARARQDSGFGHTPVVVERSVKARLLLIDDLGNEPKIEASSVSEVIFDRHAESRPTWVTTAFSPQQIADRYGDGIARRVFERAQVIRLGKVTK